MPSLSPQREERATRVPGRWTHLSRLPAYPSSGPSQDTPTPHPCLTIHQAQHCLNPSWLLTQQPEHGAPCPLENPRPPEKPREHCLLKGQIMTCGLLTLFSILVIQIFKVQKVQKDTQWEGVSVSALPPAPSSLPRDSFCFSCLLPGRAHAHASMYGHMGIIFSNFKPKWQCDRI